MNRISRRDRRWISLYFSLLVLILLIIAGSNGGGDGGTTPTLTVRLRDIQMTCRPVGFGYHCDGTSILDFSSTPPDHVHVRLNAQSISGSAATNGLSARVPLSGDVVACPFRNPSTIVVSAGTRDSTPALAVIDFSWRTTGC